MFFLIFFTKKQQRKIWIIFFRVLRFFYFIMIYLKCFFSKFPNALHVVFLQKKIELSFFLENTSALVRYL